MKTLSQLFKRKKEEPSKDEGDSEEEKDERSLLEIVCADDPEAYEALQNIMPVKTALITGSMEEEAKKGCYLAAGRLALFKGDVEKVKEYFGKYAEISGKKLKILEIPERAVRKAQEYYEKYPNEGIVIKKTKTSTGDG